MASVFRVAKRIHDPFEPKPWTLADENGVFGDRFDDPRGNAVPQEERFQVIYCATTRAGAIGETVARVRPQLDEIPGLARVRDTTDDPEPPNLHLFGLRDPVYPHRGVLLANWRLERQLYCTKLDRKMRFVDIASADSIQYLRRELAETASRLGLQDFDLSTVTGPMRDMTRECARSVYEMTDGDGTPLYAGIRYVSRLNPEWECWAIFHDRMIHRPGFPHTISPDDPDLIAIAKLFGLSIEIFAGSGQYLRP
jgi:hypothetical protein